MTATIHHHISIFLVVVPMFADVIGSGRILDRRDENFHQMVFVGEQFVNKENLQELVRTERHDNELFVVTAFPNPDTAAAFMSGKGHTDMTYGEWKQQFDALKARSPIRIMQLISIGSELVIRSVDKGRVSRTVIGSGTDPTFFQVAGRRCEILEMYSYRLPRPLQPGGGNPLIVSVYLRVAPLPDESESKLIVRELQRRLGHASITVNISTDSWFIDSARFPVLFPFEIEPTPPTLEQYKARVELFCRGSESTVVCHGFPSR
jgi:hypothetical protein